MIRFQCLVTVSSFWVDAQDKKTKGLLIRLMGQRGQICDQTLIE